MKKLCLASIVLLMIVAGCSRKVELLNRMDLNEPFYTSDWSFDTVVDANDIKSYEIQVGSGKYNQFIKWLKNNEEGWRSAPVSYVGGKWIRQNHFSLRVLEKSVVVSFIDKGEGNQYYKSIKKGELDFLFVADD